MKKEVTVTVSFKATVPEGMDRVKMYRAVAAKLGFKRFTTEKGEQYITYENRS